MRKEHLLIGLSLLTLTACSSEAEPVQSDSTAVSTTTSQTSSQVSTEIQTTQTTTRSSEAKFPYAVNLDDFVKEIATSNGDKHTTYNLTFTTGQEELPQSITLNTKDLNNFGNAIYIRTENDQEVSYPVSLSTVPTQTIRVVGNDGKSRPVKVNTQAKVEAYSDEADTLAISSDTYFLFYNQAGTISFATRNFVDNPGAEALDTQAMVEYVQTSSDESPTTGSDQSDEEKRTEYSATIKKAWQDQKDYIDSITDPKVKQSVQTSHSAAIMEASRLIAENPDDEELINKCVKEVLGEN